MPITVICAECSESHRVKDDAVGNQFKCKGCGKSLKVELDSSNLAGDGQNEDADHHATKTPMRATHSNASPKRTWSQIVIPIVIAVVAAVPAWSMFGVMLLDPRTLVQGLMASIAVFVAVGALPWFLYVNLRPKPANDQPEVDAPKFCTESLVWRASGRKGQRVSVIVDRVAGMIHFQNCATQRSFWPGSALPWFSCSLSDLRSFHNRPVKYGSALVIKTDFGKVTVFCVAENFQALFQALDDVLPGGHRRFHEDHPLAILLMIFSGCGAAVLSLILVPERLSPPIVLSLVFGSGIAATLAVYRAISFWSGKPNPRQ